MMNRRPSLMEYAVVYPAVWVVAVVFAHAAGASADLLLALTILVLTGLIVLALASLLIPPGLLKGARRILSAALAGTAIAAVPNQTATPIPGADGATSPESS